MYQIGEKVVHRSEGACFVDGFTTMEVEGVSREYYKLAPILNHKSTVYVPVEANKGKRLRPAIGTEKAELLDLESNHMEWIDHDKTRLKSMSEIVKSADFSENLKLIKTFMMRSYIKNLGSKDREILHNAQKIVYSELAIILNKSYEEVLEEKNSYYDSLHTEQV